MNLPLLEYRANQPSLEEGSPSVRGEWVSVVTHLDPRYGGLSAVVPRLASAITDTTGLRVRVAAFCAPGESIVLLGVARTRNYTLAGEPAGLDDG